MFTLTELYHGKIEFERYEPTSSDIHPVRYIPYSAIYKAQTSFGQFLYQQLQQGSFCFWKSIYKPAEDITLDIRFDRPWLGWRLMLQNHVHCISGNRRFHMFQGQIAFFHATRWQMLVPLKKDQVYEFVEMTLDASSLERMRIDSPRFEDFVTDVTEGKDASLLPRPNWSSAIVLDSLDWMLGNPLEEDRCQQFVEELIRSLVRERGTERTISESQLEQLYVVRDLIKTQYVEKMHLEQWAMTAQMNITYFKDMFRQVFELTPYHYLMFERLKAAKELMQVSPQLSLSEIAQQTGFISYNNLRRAFSTSEGKTLSEWRNLPDLLLLALSLELMEEIMA